MQREIIEIQRAIIKCNMGTLFPLEFLKGLDDTEKDLVAYIIVIAQERHHIEKKIELARDVLGAYRKHRRVYEFAG